jgi:2-keto-3-deoxy-L-fuconate dehydrogenase
MNSRRLAGKKVLITAAAQGIGRAAALAMLREGANVVATDLNEDLLDSLRSEAPAGQLETFRLDVTDAYAITLVCGVVGAVDVLFNCAGHVHQGTIFDCTEEEWDHSFAINVRSMYRMIQAVLPPMLARGGGSIINMASVCGSVKGLPNRFIYGTTKAAVVGLSKSIAADFVTRGIRCNAVAPGTVETPSLLERMRALGDIKEARRMFTARQPMGRLAQTDDIVPILVYLASDESRFATGQVFQIDGGMTI